MFKVQMSKQVFIKLFLDLVDKGFLKSDSSTDIISVNNKLSIGVRKQDLDEIIEKRRMEFNISKEFLEMAK